MKRCRSNSLKSACSINKRFFFNNLSLCDKGSLHKTVWASCGGNRRDQPTSFLHSRIYFFSGHQAFVSIQSQTPVSAPSGPRRHVWSACNSSPAPQLAPLTCPAVVKVETQLLEAALTPDPLGLALLAPGTCCVGPPASRRRLRAVALAGCGRAPISSWSAAEPQPQLIRLLRSRARASLTSSAALTASAQAAKPFQLSSRSWALSCLKTSPSSSITFCPYSCPANSSLPESG